MREILNVKNSKICRVNDSLVTPVFTHNCHTLIWWKSTRYSASANTHCITTMCQSLYIMSFRYLDSDAACLCENNKLNFLSKFLSAEMKINSIKLLIINICTRFFFLLRIYCYRYFVRRIMPPQFQSSDMVHEVRSDWRQSMAPGHESVGTC